MRKFIKYDLPTGTQIGLVTVSADIRTLANMTNLDESLRGTLAEKLPNYPNIETSNGGVSLRKGITHAINVMQSDNLIMLSQEPSDPFHLPLPNHSYFQGKHVTLDELRMERVSISKIWTFSTRLSSFPPKFIFLRALGYKWP